MSKSTPRLGKGLSAIIGQRANPGAMPKTAGGDGFGQIRQLALDVIVPNPSQPRTGFDESTLEELSRSIRAKGVLQPVIVRPAGNGRFELVVGERRWRAAKLAGLESIPALVRRTSDAESLEIAMIENLQREDLSPLERAAGYRRYIEAFDITIDELAGRLCESRANISNYLRLLKLRPEIHMLLGAGQLAMGQARAIAGIEDSERQLAVARMAVRRNLSVRQVEALARDDPKAGAKSHEAAAALPDKHHADIAQSLGRALGLGVTLKPGRKKNSGRVIIQYDNLEEFDRIAEKIGGRAALE